MRFWARMVEPLHPACFSMVMATGILALAAQMQAMPLLALGLTYLNLAVFAILIAMSVARAIWFRHAVAADLRDFHRAPGFFTTVAVLPSPAISF